MDVTVGEAMRIFVAVPAIDKIYPQMIRALYSHILQSGHECYIDWNLWDSSIARVRNEQMTRFLYGDWDYYFHISGDMEVLNHPVSENIFKTFMSRDKEFIGALYATSAEPGKCTSVFYKGEEGEVHKIKWLSGGCWMLTRKAVKKMQKAYPEVTYDSNAGTEGIVHGLFNEYIHTTGGHKILLSEDFAFCQRWLDIGGEIFVDRKIRLGHWGAKRFEL